MMDIQKDQSKQNKNIWCSSIKNALTIENSNEKLKG